MRIFRGTIFKGKERGNQVEIKIHGLLPRGWEKIDVFTLMALRKSKE